MTAVGQLASSRGSTVPGIGASVGVLRRYWWIIITVSLLTALLALFFSTVQTPMYRSSATLYVTAAADDNPQSAYQGAMASQQRVDSYARLVTSDAVISEALSASDVRLDAREARRALSASSDSNTFLLTISAESSDPELAAGLANSVAASMVRYVSEIEQPTSGGPPLAKLTVVSPASSSADQVSPRTFRNVFFGLIVGLLLGIVIVALRFFTDSRVRDRSDLAVPGVPAVLAEVPADGSLHEGNVPDFASGASLAAEAYRRLRTNISFVGVDSPARSILITSANQGEGKTTTAINFAVALAESGHRVIVVDADLRKPTLALRLGLSEGVGLTDYLRGAAQIRDLLQPSGIHGLEVLTCGQIPPNPPELLGSERARHGFAELGSMFDFVVIDSPPVLPVTDAAVVSQFADGVLVVVRADQTRIPSLASALTELQTASSRVYGLVLNDVKRGASYYGETYYGRSGSSEDLRDLGAGSAVPESEAGSRAVSSQRK